MPNPSETAGEPAAVPPPTPGRAFHAAYAAARSEIGVYATYDDLSDEARAAIEAGAQAAIAAAPACPCGGMPGTACGEELAKRGKAIDLLAKALDVATNEHTEMFSAQEILDLLAEFEEGHSLGDFEMEFVKRAEARSRGVKP